MQSPTDITQDFIDKKYLVNNGPADILLYPERLYHFLSRHGLITYFNNPDQLKKTYFRDLKGAAPDSESSILEYPKAKVIKSASLEVMLDSLLREEHLCPVRLDRNGDNYEILMAPLSAENLGTLDQFYVTFRVDIARAYSIRRGKMNRPFKSGDLPDCLAKMFVEKNAIYEQGMGRVNGMKVSDESFNPDATIVGMSPEELVRLFQKKDN
ncbi:MAG: hypothetical protein GY703_23300 [Gammaproteobacteria bacterium]|nr:hypothetical protein [Gammaproteobacteria bacterium]